MVTENEMELSISEIFSIITKRLLLIALCIICGTVGAFTITKYCVDKEYTTSVSMYVAPSNQDADVYAALSDLNYAQKVVNTYIEILKTNNFLESVAITSGLQYSVSDIQKSIIINAVNETEIFRVTVTTKNPEESFIIANTIAKLAPEKIIEIKNANDVKVVDPAVLPTKPSAPNVSRNTALGFALGFVIGVMIAILLEIFDKRVKDEDDLLKHHDVPILGRVPKITE